MVGLSIDQMVDALADKGTLFRAEAERQVANVMRARRALLDQVEHTEYSNLETHYANAVFAAEKLRDLGDLIVAAYFSKDKPKLRVAQRNEWINAYESNQVDIVAAAIHNLRVRLLPFHWELEFPEVFDEEVGGFSVIVGNPPFLGGTRISTVAGMAYFQWITSTYAPCGHLCDLVAYFFRRAFDLLCERGAFGLIATNTISQGDTREGGLRIVLREGGQAYAVNRRFRWPGAVAVVVSVVHITKRYRLPEVRLDGKRISRISAYLTEGTNDDSPARLLENPYFSIGSKIYGQGFLFCDGDPECTPISGRDQLIAKRPDLAERILPYIGGEELLSDPRQMYDRYVILLSDLQTEEELDRWPELRDIVREKVKPERELLGDNPNNVPLKRKWWAFQAHRPELYERLKLMHRVLVTSLVNPRFGFALMPADRIFSHKAAVFCIDRYAGFAIIQCRVHEFWARYFSSTSIELMSYTPSDCFETFPFPPNWSEDETLERIGEEYHHFRADLMVRNNEGLTKTFNRFHDKYEDDAGIQTLRDLHQQMDRAVLDAYGWTDLQPVHDFILDYEEPDEAVESGRTRKKKEPWRYRWTDEFRDEVLARLLELNRQRAEEERKVAEAAKLSATATKTAAKKTRKKAEPAAPTLAGWEETE